MLNKKLIWRAAGNMKEETFTISELIEEIEKEIPIDFDPNAKMIYKCDDIINVVTTSTKLNRQILMARSRRRDIVRARQITMYLMDKYTKFTCTKIGFVLNRNHATVIHGIGVIKDALGGFDKELKVQVEQAEKMLRMQGNAEKNSDECIIHGCNEKKYALGLCQYHYKLQHRLKSR